MMVVFTKIIYIQIIASKVLEENIYIYKIFFFEIKGSKKKIKSPYGKQLAKLVYISWKHE